MQIYFNSVIGFMTLECTNKKLTKIRFGKYCDDQKSSEEILNETKNQLEEYFAKKRKSFNIDFELIGTDFQKKVWIELSKIQYGTTISYKELANRIGNPLAIRAVANSNRLNPIPIIFPCHRVIGSDGKMVGFSAGIDKKIELLKIEGYLL